MDIKQFVYDRAVEAKKGARELGRASSEDKNKALLMMAALIRERAATLKTENDKDIVAAKEKGLAEEIAKRESSIAKLKERHGVKLETTIEGAKAKIAKIADLPYYNGYEEVVNQFYLNLTANSDV